MGSSFCAFCASYKLWVGLSYLPLGRFCLRLVFVAYGQLGLVFSTYGWNSVWSFLLTVPPVRKLGLVFSAYGSPCPEIPSSSFPCQFGFPCLFAFQGIPCDFEHFSPLSQGFKGSARTRNPRLFGGFPCRFPKRQGKEDQGWACSFNLRFPTVSKKDRKQKDLNCTIAAKIITKKLFTKKLFWRN